MSKPTKTISVTLLDEKISLKCPLESVDALKQCEAALNQRLAAVKKQSPMVKTEHVLGVTAINLLHELEVLKQEHQQKSNRVAAKIHDLEAQLELTFPES